MQTVLDVLSRRAALHPSRTAFIVLGSSGQEVGRTTYAELHERVQRMARALLALGPAPGSRVLIAHPSGIDFIESLLGCLHAGLVAVPAFPPRKSRTLGRLAAIVRDSGATLAVGDVDQDDNAPLFAAAGVRVVRPGASDGDAAPLPAVSPETLAIIQYTSGSTTDPKGVMLTHANIVQNEQMIQEAFGTSEESVIVGWLPLYHDMGLIGTVLQPLFAGATAVLMSPSTFVSRPARWLETITRYRATISGGPNFAYDLCADRITPQDRQNLDLSSWRVAFNGAEPIRRSTLDRFAREFADCGFAPETLQPCYGLAEATLFVAGPRQGRAVEASPAATGENDLGPRAPVSSGVWGAPTDVVIVDPATGLASADGAVGEIWVSGPHVAAGYWNRPAETEYTFGARRADVPDSRTHLRTGDLGFIRGGALFVTGRLKDLIIVRGQNHYPHDIEATVQECHPALCRGGGAAFALESDTGVVVVQESLAVAVDEQDAMLTAIRERVAAVHEVALAAVTLVAPHTVPKTSSGKIRRLACRDAWAAGELTPIAEWREGATPEGRAASGSRPGGVAGALAGEIAALLRVAPDSLAADVALSRYGLDSARAIQLSYALEERLGITVAAASLFDMTVTELAAMPRVATSGAGRPTAAAAPETEWPASYGQHALWLLHQLDPGHTAYHIANAFTVPAALDAAALDRAIAALAQRHPSLRSTLVSRADGLVQRLQSPPPRLLQVVDASADADEVFRQRLEAQAREPIDLEHGPLLRVHLFQRGTSSSVLLFVIHHVIADLWSLTVLLEDLATLYAAEAAGTTPVLPANEWRFSDYVRQQRAAIESAGAEELRRYWAEQFAQPVAKLDLASQRAPSAERGECRRESFVLPREVVDRLRAIGDGCGATLYATMLAIFALLLHRRTAQRDLVIGSPVAGRQDRRFARVIGYFVNTLPIRSVLPDDSRFTDYLVAMRRHVVGALQHDGAPYSWLVEQLRRLRPQDEPLSFQAMFTFQELPLGGSGLAPLALGMGGVVCRCASLTMESIALPARRPPADLLLTVAPADGGLCCALDYDASVIDTELARGLAGGLRALAAAIVEVPTAPVSSLEVLSGDEREQLALWNRTAREWPLSMRLDALIEQQAARTPDAIAVCTSDGRRLTYAELNRRANRLAQHLVRRGVDRDTPIGVLIDRSPEMMVALLGVLKAGAAFLSLDSSHPSARVCALVRETGAPIVLGERRHRSLLADSNAELFCLDTDWGRLQALPEFAPPLPIAPDNLAYVIHTSGSTGRPKGVANTHRGICNRLLWMQAEYGLRPGDRVLQKTPLTFDVCLWELFWPLIAGASLVLAKPGEHGNAEHLVDLIAREGVTVTHFVPSVLRVFLAHPRAHTCRSLRLVIASGEALDRATAEKCAAVLPARLHNLYGPTEAAVDVTHWACTVDDAGPIPIGRPIANTQIRVLDAHMRELPVGVAGDLYIAGQNLARGYIEQPALTAAAFVPDPYGAPGDRLYRTGDIGRWRPDGSIDFIGRRDHQVKIRGMRVEVGEIEAALNQLSGVRDGAVVVHRVGTDDVRLIACVVMDDESDFVPGRMREALARTLPAHLIPARFVRLDVLPLLSNGKLDRRSLPIPDERTRDLATPFVAPRDEVEERLAAMWQDAFTVDRVGVHDSFFELGGHSLMVAQLVWQMRDAFGVEVPVRALFDRPTVEGVADEVRARLAEQAPDTAVSVEPALVASGPSF